MTERKPIRMVERTGSFRFATPRDRIRSIDGQIDYLMKEIAEMDAWRGWLWANVVRCRRYKRRVEARHKRDVKRWGKIQD